MPFNPGSPSAWATMASLVTAVALSSPGATEAASAGWLLVNALSSAALLGAATTAMLMGHSYLIAPTMSLTPRFLSSVITLVQKRAPSLFSIQRPRQSRWPSSVTQIAE